MKDGSEWKSCNCKEERVRERERIPRFSCESQCDGCAVYSLECHTYNPTTRQRKKELASAFSSTARNVDAQSGVG